MLRFARLYAELDASTATGDKLAALARYLADTALAAPHDAAWAMYFLAGGKPRQVLPTALLRQTACALAGIDDWLFEECYQAVGDLAETIALVLPPPHHAPSTQGLAEWIETRLLSWRGLSPLEQAAALREALGELDGPGRFLLVKLIGGGFRVGVSKLLVQRALAEHAGLDPKRVAERMMGYTDAKATPSAARLAALLAAEGASAADGVGTATRGGQPYPFFLAHALQADPATLGELAGWQVEWKYDGIRAQLVRRDGRTWIWSRGEELVTERFPELVAWARAVPEGTVLDGEILAWRDSEPLPFKQLQTRITRQTLSKKLLAEVPVRFLAYDMLERDGHDLRGQPQAERRAALEHVVEAAHRAPLVEARDWPALAALRATSRARGVEGLMLKQKSGAYGAGRTKSEGTWWKWKVEPLVADAVLIYAQAGHGRRAGVYTDYTFAVWSRAPADAGEAQAVVEAITRREPARADTLQLVPFAKAYSGLTDDEFARVSTIVKQTTLEKFGPVRSVRPTLVFELGFEAIHESGRHKSGIAVRFPRMLRIRDDKPLHEADTLQNLRALMSVA